jgi:hypothetical protein
MEIPALEGKIKKAPYIRIMDTMCGAFINSPGVFP